MTLYRSNYTYYNTQNNTIHIDSLINAFSSIDNAKKVTTDYACEILNNFQAANADDKNIRFELSFNKSRHFCILNKITKDDDGRDIKSIALVIFDIFTVEETSENCYKYRDDFIVKAINDEEYIEKFGQGYWQVLLNENNEHITYKCSLGEALLFVDYFIHSHLICAAINGDLHME